MSIEKITCGGKVIAGISDKNTITDVQTALDTVISAKYDLGTSLVAIDKKALDESFFILSSGLAGEILQKFINYGVKAAVYGDYSKYTSKPLKDFIYESNKGKDIFFVATKEEAAERLAAL